MIQSSSFCAVGCCVSTGRGLAAAAPAAARIEVLFDIKMSDRRKEKLSRFAMKVMSFISRKRVDTVCTTNREKKTFRVLKCANKSQKLLLLLCIVYIVRERERFIQSAVSKQLPHHSRSDLLENTVATLSRCPVARDKRRWAHGWPTARQAA